MFHSPSTKLFKSQIFLALVLSWTLLGCLVAFDHQSSRDDIASSSPGSFLSSLFEASSSVSSSSSRRALLQEETETSDEVTAQSGPMARASVWNPIIQPTTILRIALLIIQNAALNNPTAGFLQMVLNTELALTRFSNVFASLAAGVVQDYSQGVSSSSSIGNEWVIDGESIFTSSKASEFVVGGAFGLEQFFGVGFEVTGDAAAAIAQFLKPNPFNELKEELMECHSDTNGTFYHFNETFYHDDGTEMASETAQSLNDFSNCTNTTMFHKGDQKGEEEEEEEENVGQRRKLQQLTKDDLKKRKMPENVQKILVHERVKVPKFLEKAAAQHTLNRHQARQQNDHSEHPSFFNDEEKRRRLQEIVNDEDENGDDARKGNVTFDDVEALTTEWFDSFPNALPISIRDNFLALLEETIVDPQIRIEIEIIVALVGVAEPGRGTTAAEVASEVEWIGQVVLHGYDAAIDVASIWETANAIAGSASKGLAIAEAINDATEIVGAVTEIVDTVNAIQSENIRGAESDGSVEAQSGDDGSSTINVTELSQYVKPISVNDTVRARKDSYSPDTASCENGDGLCVDSGDGQRRRRRVLLQQGPIGPEIIGGGGLQNVLGQFTPTGGESEAFGAISGTYAATVALVFLEQVSINGGSITII